MDLELFVLSAKVQPLILSFLSLLLKMILLTIELSAISMSKTKAIFELLVLKAKV